MRRNNLVMPAAVVVYLVPLAGCQHLVIDKEKLFRPGEVSEIVGFLAGFGTTFAAVPDLLAMLRRRSSEGMNPRMGVIMGAFQVLWVYYGLLIASRPVILWNHGGPDQLRHGWCACLLLAPAKTGTWCGNELIAQGIIPLTARSSP